MSALLILDLGTTAVYTSVTDLHTPSKDAPRPGYVHRFSKRQIRNADYALNSPPKPIDSSTSRSNASTSTTSTASADPGKSTAQKRRLHESEFAPEISLDNLDCHDRRCHLDLSSDSASWKRHASRRSRLLEQRATTPFPAVRLHPCQFCSGIDKEDVIRNVRHKQRNFRDSRDCRECKSSCRTENGEASEHTATFDRRHIVKHYSFPRISVVKHTLPPPKSLAGRSSNQKKIPTCLV